nr:MAG TPA: Calcium signal-modulating cyclophilin ligand [Caudoviricetes sp.]
MSITRPRARMNRIFGVHKKGKTVTRPGPREPLSLN